MVSYYISPFVKEEIDFLPKTMIYDKNSKTCENVGSIVKINVDIFVEYTSELEFMG